MTAVYPTTTRSWIVQTRSKRPGPTATEEVWLPFDEELRSEMVPPDLLHVYLAARYGSEAVELLNNTPTKKAA